MKRSKGFEVTSVKERNPALIQLYMEGGVESRLVSVSAAARRLFEAVSLSDVPLEQSAVEESLELFEIDEPTRSLAAQRLVRVRRTGDLSEIDVYHDRLRCTVSP